MSVLLQQRARGEQDAGSAVAALRGAELRECDLEMVQLRPARHALDGRDRPTLHLQREDEAAQVRPAVDEHGARAALSELAAVLGPGEPHVLAQDLEQRLVRRHEQVAALAVDIEREHDPLDIAEDLVLHSDPSISLSALTHFHRSGATASARLWAGAGSSGWTRIVRMPSARAGSMSFSSRFPITTHRPAATPARSIAISNT